jgi:cobalt-zinc-cadmium efflux system outer membrane protein
LNNIFDAAISFLDLFFIPLRKRAAEAEIKVIESLMGQKVLDLAQEVQVNWLEVKSLELQMAEERKLIELKEITAVLANLQSQSGNISALQARSREIQYKEAVEKLKGFEAEIEIGREKLNRSLGLFGKETGWKIAGEIDWKNEVSLPDLNVMEKAALENRLDIEAIRRETHLIAQKAKLKEWWTYTNLMVGASSEKQPEGFTTTGPSISLIVPIFNHGQGEKKKYHAQLEQTQRKLLSKAVEACSDVRGFLKTVHKYRSQLEDLESSILPSLQQQMILGQAHYNVMTLGVYGLLDLKANELQATIERIQVLQKYKKARINLLYAVGGSFDLVRKQE